MLLLFVLLISVATPARFPNSNALKPAPPNDPYLIRLNWPFVILEVSKLIITVEIGAKDPLTLIIEAVGLPKVFGFRFIVQPAKVIVDTFNELPTLEISKSNAVLLAMQ